MKADSSMTSKPRRSKAACTACRAMKQRCGGPSKQPCGRCELYGIECIFESYGRGNHPHISSPEDLPPEGLIVPRPTSVSAPSTLTYPNNHNTKEVSEQLREISEKLTRIEQAVTLKRRNSYPSPSESSPSQYISPDSAASGNCVTNPTVPLENDAARDPEAPILAMQKVLKKLNPLSEEVEILTRLQRPDAITQGILTEDIARELFQFYFDTLHSWFGILRLETDANFDLTRKSNPFLFHVILVTSAYYKCLETQLGRSTYYALAEIAAHWLGTHTFFFKEKDVYIGCVKALMLLLTRKPIRLDSKNNFENFPSLSNQLASKLNDSYSYVVSVFAFRSAQVIGLSKGPIRYLEAINANQTPSAEVIDQTRVWMGLLSIDMTISHTGGRPPVLDATSAALIARHFAHANFQNGDPSLVSLVDLRGAWKKVNDADKGYSPVSMDPKILEYLRDEFTFWEQYWFPILGPSTTISSQTLMRIVCSRFFLLSYHARAMRAWIHEAETQGIHSDDVVRNLPEEKWKVVESAMIVAESIVFALSMESKQQFYERAVDWGNRTENNIFPPLTPCTLLAEAMKYSIDPVICMVIPYAMLFLLRCASERFFTCSLKLNKPVNGQIILDPKKMKFGDKLHRLTELTSTFLTIAKPNLTHPAASHAQLFNYMSERSVAKFLDGTEPPPSYFASTPSIRVPESLNLPTTNTPSLNLGLDSIIDLNSSFGDQNAFLGFDFNGFDWTTLGLSNLDVTTQNVSPGQSNSVTDFLITPLDTNLGYNGDVGQDSFMVA